MQRAEQTTVFSSCYSPRATFDMETQIPIIVDAPPGLTIERVRIVAGAPSLIGTDGQECRVWLHWSNGAVETGAFYEWLSVYGQATVAWRRTAFFPPGHTPLPAAPVR